MSHYHSSGIPHFHSSFNISSLNYSFFLLSLALSPSRPTRLLDSPWKEEKQLTLLSRSFRLGDATLSRDNSLKSEARSILLMLISATLPAWQCAGLLVSSLWRDLDWNFAQAFMVCAWWKVITLEPLYYSYQVTALCQNLSSSSCWLSCQKKWSLTVQVWARVLPQRGCVCTWFKRSYVQELVSFHSACMPSYVRVCEHGYACTACSLLWVILCMCTI